MDRFTDQEFLYRQVPVNYDGIARINSIKGNTISFNQLVSTKDYSNSQIDTRTYFQFLVQRTSPSVTNIISERIENTGIYKRIVTPTVSTNYYFKHNGLTADLNFFSLPLTANHKYLVSFDFTGVLPNSVGGLSYTNAMIMDLTLMGIDNLTTTAGVENWLSTHIGNIPYFDYGYRLISFNGTGVKTFGVNQWDEQWEVGSISGSTGLPFDSPTYIRSKNFIPIDSSKSYYAKSPYAGKIFCLYYDANGTYIGTSAQGVNANTVFTPNVSGARNMKFTTESGGTYENNISINYPSTITSYEPYTSNTLSLPISTYFPTGMKSAGSVYDELSDKAYTRVGSVDLGSLEWTTGGTNTTGKVRFQTNVPNLKYVDTDAIGNYLCAKYPTISARNTYRCNNGVGTTLANILFIYDEAYSASDVTTFKNAMSGQYLYFEMETPTETDISLDLTYPVWDGGTEQILPVNTSTPTTAPIKADIDYATGIVEVVTHPEPTQGGQTSGDGWYLVGEEATVVGTPSEHYVFDSWELDGEIVSTDPSYTFEVTNE